MFTEQESKELRALLIKRGLPEDFRIVGNMCGDGSDRRFCRFDAGGISLLAVLPTPGHPQGMAEARAAHNLGCHFHRQGAAVPEIYGFVPESGLILFEDLGDIKLYDLIQQEGLLSGIGEGYYRQAVDALACFQILTRPGFDPSWCYDTPRYDRELMLARESGYFQKALCEDYLGLTVPPGLSAEFVRLADRAAQEPADYVLHRDFQSRNLMVHAGKIRIIDYQGARLGPLGYDLAALLIDPYVAMPQALQQSVLSWYLDALARHIDLDRDRFVEGYYYMALQRNLQILGAFAFLSRNRGKDFFRQFITPANRNLYEHLSAPQGRDFPLLRGVVEQARNFLEHNTH